MDTFKPEQKSLLLASSCMQNFPKSCIPEPYNSLPFTDKSHFLVGKFQLIRSRTAESKYRGSYIQGHFTQRLSQPHSRTTDLAPVPMWAAGLTVFNFSGADVSVLGFEVSGLNGAYLLCLRVRSHRTLLILSLFWFMQSLLGGLFYSRLSSSSLMFPETQMQSRDVGVSIGDKFSQSIDFCIVSSLGFL